MGFNSGFKGLKGSDKYSALLGIIYSTGTNAIVNKCQMVSCIACDSKAVVYLQLS